MATAYDLASRQIGRSHYPQRNRLARCIRTSTCGDLLESLEHKPPHLDLLDCRTEMRHPVHADVAHYRVAGPQAETVERHFTKANMPALVFLCCGWDSVWPAGRDGLSR
ncbi:MAG: DUF4952 domain-containing protein [Phyllobacterium sp.]